MTYLEPMVLALAVGGFIAAVGLSLLGLEKWSWFAMVMVGGLGFIMATNNYQSTGKLGALIGAYACAGISGIYFRNLVPRPNRAERQKWRQLFPQVGLWGMLRNDPRLVRWRK